MENNVFEKHIIDEDSEIVSLIKNGLLDTYFSLYNKDHLSSDIGKHEIAEIVFLRYNQTLRHVLPWISKHIDLKPAKVIEIGCGTGCSTAAFTHIVEHIDGYDIDESAILGAHKRMEVFGFKNYSLHLIKAENLIMNLLKNNSDGADLILLYAVLEHMTPDECINTIKTCWRLLRPKGLLVVTETPNRLTYSDKHTSLLPFFQMLPYDLCLKYYQNSPRDVFVESMERNIANKSIKDATLRLNRWGRGISYHEFEIALGNAYKNNLVAQGFEAEILSWFAVTKEEELLRRFIEDLKLKIPIGFTRECLNLIYKKFNTTSENCRVPEIQYSTGLNNDSIRENYELKLKERKILIESKKMEIREKDRIINSLLRDKELIYSSWAYRIGNYLLQPFMFIRFVLKNLKTEPTPK